MSVREQWQEEVNWTDGVFESLEHFVNSKPQNQIEAFAQSGQLGDLYNGGTIPTLPSETHKRYLQAYAASKSVQESDAPVNTTPEDE